MTSSIELTQDQQNAYNQFVSFLADSNKHFFLLEGFAGTGKSTLVKHILSNLSMLNKTLQLLTQKETNYTYSLTATTNQAARNLNQVTGLNNAVTIFRFLGLSLKTDPVTGESSIVDKKGLTQLFKLNPQHIIFIDEASYIDHTLLKTIVEKLQDAKVVFIGDPAQVTPVKCKGNAPVFTCGFPTARLETVVRQANDSPILDLATQFRRVVEGGEWPSVAPDGQHIIHLPQSQFKQVLADALTSNDPPNAKILTYTNKASIAYNNAIEKLNKGTSVPQANTAMICNSYIKLRDTSIRTDSEVIVRDVRSSSEFGYPGYHVLLAESDYHVFMPESLEVLKRALKNFKATSKFKKLKHVTRHWIDLRSAHSCTINKSQGSTYDYVFIDLNDVSKCRDPKLMARLLYVAVSRARYQVIFTGDLVS